MSIEKKSIKKLIFAGGEISEFSMTASVLSAWMWATSIFGSAEAYELYGFPGSLAYVCGACISFAILIPVVIHVRKSIPKTETYFKLFSGRCSSKVKSMFYLFAVCVSAYVLIEQAVGIADVCERTFDTSFKIVGFLSVIITTVFIASFGMKGLLRFEKTAFLVIISGFLLLIIKARKAGYLTDCIEDAFSGNISDVVMASAIRYFIVAIIIACGQLLLDPAWYIKASMAKSEKIVKRSFSLGGVILWGSMTLVSSLLVGPMLQSKLSIVFVLIIIFIGIGTIGHYMIGMLGIFTIDFYSSYLKPSAADSEKILFGRVMTIVIGILCGLIAISLEGISLLTIDMFCAVFFSAACIPFLFIVTDKKQMGIRPLVAVMIGLLVGFVLWTGWFIPDAWQDIAGAVGAFTAAGVIMMPHYKRQ